jgi:DeoR family fructose operon transcriptional repressor
VLIFDAGTTLFALAQVLPPVDSLTVFTPGLNIAQRLASMPEVEVRLLGGRLLNESMETIGDAQAQGLQSVLANWAFLGAGGVDADLDMTETTFDLAASKRNMFGAARQRALLLDSAKFRIQHRVKALNLAQFDLVITDSELPDEMRESLSERGVKLQVM